jgi:hypothetical protein
MTERTFYQKVHDGKPLAPNQQKGKKAVQKALSGTKRQRQPPFLVLGTHAFSFFYSPLLTQMLMFCACLAHSSLRNQWANSSDGVHTFLTFDSGSLLAKLKANPHDARASRLDFVWGASHSGLQALSVANPATLTSKYIPCCRDGITPVGAAGLENYTKRGWASRVLYQCDRKTPAWYVSKTENASITARVPLDFTNPAVVDWQVEEFAKPAAIAGYDAMALDNVELENGFQACGIWRTPTQWVQLFNGSLIDPSYQSAITGWLSAVRGRVSALMTKRGLPMKIIPNFSLHNFQWNDSAVFRVGNASDGILTESGFLGGGYRGPTMPYDYIGDAWVQRIRFMRNLQLGGKAYYSVNAYGDRSKPNMWRTPCLEDPHNCIDLSVRQWVLGSYLMGKEQSAAIALYKFRAKEGSEWGYGNWSYQSPEWDANVGVALAPPVETETGLWSRDYSNALVLLNPWPDRGALGGVVPAAPAGRGGWEDLYGNTVPPGELQLKPVTAITLILRPFTGVSVSFSSPTLVGQGGGSDTVSAFPNWMSGGNNQRLVAGPNHTLLSSKDGGTSWTPQLSSSFLSSHVYLFPSPIDRSGNTLQDLSVDGMQHFLDAPAVNFSSVADGYTNLHWGSSLQKLHGKGVIRYIGLPEAVWYFRTNSGNVLAGDVLLQTVNVLFVSNHPSSKPQKIPKPTSVVLFKSTDGLLWKFVAVVASPHDCSSSVEGPNESALTKLANGDLLVVMRIDGGDGGSLKPFVSTTSSDGGLSWSPPAPMADKAGRGIGAARPKFLHVQTASGKRLLLLTGSRPGIFVWACTDTDDPKGGSALAWDAYNIAAQHNGGLHGPNATSWAFGPEIVAAKNFTQPYQSGGYQSLVHANVNGTSALVAYSRHPIPGHEQAEAVFAMRLDFS